MNKNLGILLYENVQPIDVIGPWEVFSFWKYILDAPLNMYLISEQGGFVPCDNGIVLKADHKFDDCPQLDYLIVPGGRGRVTQVNNAKLIGFIKKQAVNSQYILSVCTGMFLLHKAGLLQDKSATTYWRALPELKKYSEVHVREERIVKSARVWTSGGVTSGIDLALEFIAEIAGKETAGKVQLLLEYFPKDIAYCSLNTANALPPYFCADSSSNPELPEYVRAWLTKLKS